MSAVTIEQLAADVAEIKAMLRQLVGGEDRCVLTPISGEVSDIQTEIARVKAAGGNLAEHFKAKARARMAEEKGQRIRGGKHV
jgi:uncharacterized protein YoxC